MRLEVYGKANCAMCKSTKAKLTHLMSRAEGAPVATLAFVDMDTIEGLAEGAFNDVHNLPTTIVRSASGDPLARWEGRVPPSVEVQAFLASSKPSVG